MISNKEEKEKQGKEILKREQQDPKKRLDNVVENLKKVAGEIEYEYFESSNELNANVIRSGKIGITKGLINQTNDDELAFVISHELVHRDKKHFEVHQKEVEEHWEQASESFDRLLERVKGGPITKFVAGAALFTAAKIGSTINSNIVSRKCEKEADTDALDLMNKAGYNSEAAEKFISKHGHNSDGFINDLFCSHPTKTERVQNIKSTKNSN